MKLSAEYFVACDLVFDNLVEILFLFNRWLSILMAPITAYG